MVFVCWCFGWCEGELGIGFLGGDGVVVKLGRGRRGVRESGGVLMVACLVGWLCESCIGRGVCGRSLMMGVLSGVNFGRLGRRVWIGGLLSRHGSIRKMQVFAFT